MYCKCKIVRICKQYGTKQLHAHLEVSIVDLQIVTDMKKYEGFCPIRDIMAEVGSKWALLILHTIGRETLRFSEIWRGIPDISQKVLTSELRTLESFSLIKRSVYAEVPPRVEYELTELGHSFMDAMTPVIQWAKENKEVCLLKR